MRKREASSEVENLNDTKTAKTDPFAEFRQAALKELSRKQNPLQLAVRCALFGSANRVERPIDIPNPQRQKLPEP